MHWDKFSIQNLYGKSLLLLREEYPGAYDQEQATPDSLSANAGTASITVPPVAPPPVPAPETPPETPEAPQRQQAKPAPVEWKTKRGARLTALLLADEFDNKKCTGLLKKIVLAMEIPFPLVGFGKVNQAGLSREEVAAMPTPYGLVFGRELLSPELASEPQGFAPAAGKQLYRVASLSTLLQDKEAKKAAWAVMKRFKDELYT